jgi:hypothetical protein
MLTLGFTLANRPANPQLNEGKDDTQTNTARRASDEKQRGRKPAPAILAQHRSPPLAKPNLVEHAHDVTLLIAGPQAIATAKDGFKDLGVAGVAFELADAYIDSTLTKTGVGREAPAFRRGEG